MQWLGISIATNSARLVCVSVDERGSAINKGLAAYAACTIGECQALSSHDGVLLVPAAVVHVVKLQPKAHVVAESCSCSCAVTARTALCAVT